MSTHCIPAETKSITKISNEQQNWYALRTTYGREKKAYDYLVAKGVSAFYPTIKVMKEIRGQRKVVTESRLPNLYSVSGIETHAQGLSFLSAGSKTVSRANNSLNHSCPDRRGPEGRLQELRDALWDIGRAGKYVNCSIAELRPGVNGKMRGGYHG